jgi:DNA-binding transcriptional ArsR family regulator
MGGTSPAPQESHASTRHPAAMPHSDPGMTRGPCVTTGAHAARHRSMAGMRIFDEDRRTRNPGRRGMGLRGRVDGGRVARNQPRSSTPIPIQQESSPMLMKSAVRPAFSRQALTCKLRLAYLGGVSDIFEALAAPARRAILDELHERDGQTLFELCTRLTMKHGLGLSRQGVSQHLDVLESAGLVTTRREGRYKFHYLDTAPLRGIVERWSIQP